MITAEEFLLKNNDKLLRGLSRLEIKKMMEEYTKIHAVEIIKKLSKTEAEYQNNIKYVFPQYNIK